MNELKDKIERALVEPFENDSNFLNLMAKYHLAVGGKRIRAKLALIHAQELSVTFTDAMKWAIACEILHNATLVHDDIQDEDPLRRGQPSVWTKFGRDQAINLGDYLIFNSVELLGSIEIKRAISNLVSCLADKAKCVAVGQSREINMARQATENYWQEYLQVAELKTGALLQAPVQGIEFLAGHSAENAEERSHMWRKIGLVYQINDDINDFLGKKQDNQCFKDFFEQKINSLVAWLSLGHIHKNLIQDYLECEKGSEQQAQIIKQLCHQINKNGVLDDLTHVQKSFFQQFLTSTDSQASRFLIQFLIPMKSEETTNDVTVEA